MAEKSQKPRVHHILGDGREVESIAGYEVSLEQVPQIKRMYINRIERLMHNGRNGKEKTVRECPSSRVNSKMVV